MFDSVTSPDPKYQLKSHRRLSINNLSFNPYLKTTYKTMKFVLFGILSLKCNATTKTKAKAPALQTILR
jgi:hypothetical protein